ncbi:restriction endonuclease subunit S [Subdoligranulum sp. DSM 109015]|uniref:Restriction endonuclease subunit S n=1 Tax=Gemmiger gallinarum TaxID=2779354 RepID=A0ABR9R305_9FIRM|nr:restriction endonuclease subunit S [Gemmiger gallinarum]MBE5037455.1 restriction endonuclease subunit S [Gemmiger gallinarum]
MKSEWKSSTIGEACLLVTDGSHSSPKSTDTGEYMVSVKDFTPYGFDFSSCKRISSEDYAALKRNGCVPKVGDILVGKDGARYFEDIIIYDQPEHPALLSSIAILRCNPQEIVSEFLYYLMKTPSFKQHVRDNYGSGSAIPRIILKDFKRMPIQYPAIDEQEKICSLLSRIDGKIKVNIQINDNLEQQAQTLFQKLFVENVNFKWRKGTISDLGTVVGGSTPSKSKPEYYTEHGIAWITPKDLSVNKSKFIAHGENDITELGLKNSSASIMPEGTVLFSSRAPIGYIAIAAGEVTTNQGFKSVVPKAEIGTPFVYYFLKNALPTIEGMASGSTFKEVSGSTMKDVPALIPDSETLAKFNEFCGPLFGQQQMLERQNQSLAALRDSLLPKLMSGEIDVSDVSI